MGGAEEIVENNSLPRVGGGLFEKFSAANSKIEVEIEANTKELTLAW